MESRYDFMTESTVLDDDGQAYPDCLSINFSDVKITEVPTFTQATFGDINKFWSFMLKNYSVPMYDDILLGMNMVPYVGMLKPGTIIANFSLKDLINFHTSKVKRE